MSEREDFHFHEGQKIVGGESFDATHVKESKASNGYSKYYTTRWADGTLSCDCRGWTVKKQDKPRTCKHVKASEASNCDDMTPVEAFVAEAPATIASSQMQQIAVRTRTRTRRTRMIQAED